MLRKPKTEEELQKGLQRMFEAHKQLREKKGPIYEKWLSRTQAYQAKRLGKVKTQPGG